MKAEWTPLPELSETPVFAGQQSFACEKHSMSGTVYSYDFGSPELARKNAALLGERMWKGPRPSPEHPDEILIQGAVVVIVNSGSDWTMKPLMTALVKKGFAVAHSPAPESEEPREAELAEMKRRMPCTTAGRAAYCEALDAFAKGAPAAPPIGPLVGRSLAVNRSTLQETPSVVLVRDGRGRLDSYRSFDPLGRAQAEEASFLAHLSTGKPPSPDDPVVARARAVRLDDDASEARRISGSLVILDGPAPVFVREAAGSIIAVRRVADVNEFEVAIFMK